ncbi:sporulation membrane protein YtaF [Phosphitispora fastidiosa]|uniref:sporulation membrane protein YtaF n=1 Tax=Phosphitispora fastidiosa TaxID=2837202 RepID=UPI001E307A02|nr:putative sporulation protein YtaF [Phosphitispora fastidiosa]
MELLSIIAFATALSLDGFGVGISYGMRKIRIPVLSLVVISLTSSTAIGLTMLSGHFVSQYISAEMAEIIGASILILVGLWILLQTWSKKESHIKPGEKSVGEHNPECQTILDFKIEAFGLVIKIMREPTVADFDKSGFISVKEALLLGLALAMDAIGAGFGAAMTGFTPVLTPLIVGIVKFLMVSLGVILGRRYAVNWLGNRAAVLPGWVLIMLGVARVMKI